MLISGLFETETVSWKESWKYKWFLCRSSEKKDYKFRAFIVISVIILSVLMWVLSGKQVNFSDALFSGLLVGLFIIFPIYWLVVFSPRKVRFLETKVMIDRQEVKYADIDLVVFGSVELLGSIFASLSIRTKNGSEHLVELKKSVDVDRLEQYLADSRVPIEK